MTAVDEKSYAAWYVSWRSRLPFLVPVAIAASLWIYAGASGYGRKLASADAEKYQAELLACVAQYEVSESENAAPLWDQAAAALDHWRDEEDGPEPTSPKADWDNPEYSGKDGAVAAYLARNQQALALAEKAAALDRALWPPPYDRFPTSVRDFCRYPRNAMLAAAFRRDWPTVKRMAQLCLQAADHCFGAPLYWNFVVARGGEEMTLGRIAAIVQRWPAALDEEATTCLLELVESRQEVPLPLRPALESGVLLRRLELATACSGQIADPTGGSGPLSRLKECPLLVNIFSGAYPLVRPYMLEEMERVVPQQEAILAGDAPPDDAQRQASASGSKANFLRWTAQMTVSSKRRAGVKALATIATRRLVYAALLASRHRYQHGEWAESLARVKANRKWLTDPLDAAGAELNYRVLVDGRACLWSVGLREEHTIWQVARMAKDREASNRRSGTSYKEYVLFLFPPDWTLPPPPAPVKDARKKSGPFGGTGRVFSRSDGLSDVFVKPPSDPREEEDQ